MDSNKHLILMHYVLQTKGRAPSLALVDDARFLTLVLEAHRPMGAELVTFGLNPDHCHLVTLMPTTVAPAEYVRRVKTALTRRLRAIDDVPDDFAWAPGYHAYSVSRSRLESVRGFVMLNGRVHERMSLREELAELERRHESPGFWMEHEGEVDEAAAEAIA